MELLKAVLIHLALPLIGVWLYLSLAGKMLHEPIRKPPVISFFLIFATWGSLAVLVLTSFFWYWSGMATLGLAYLILVAPFAMVTIAIFSYLNRRLSRFHRAAFIASLSYVPIIVLVIVGSRRCGVPFK